MLKPTLKSRCAELNQVIHSHNLYREHSRFIDARVREGMITVKNLSTGEVVVYTGDGWRDGYGAPVTV